MESITYSYTEEENTRIATWLVDAYAAGVANIRKFESLNHPVLEGIPLAPVKINMCLEPLRVRRASGLYENNQIYVNVCHCVHYSMTLSYPGGIADMTPYGVIAHEYGHCIDDIFRRLKLPDVLRSLDVLPITRYHPNKHEYFAELFKVFMTNSDLLRCSRPKAYAKLTELFIPSETRLWKDLLVNAPENVLRRCNAEIRSGNR